MTLLKSPLLTRPLRPRSTTLVRPEPDLAVIYSRCRPNPIQIVMEEIREFDATLRDGRGVHVRALRPSDEAEILQAFHRMSDHARYMRFMRVVKEPNLDRLRATLASFPARGLGLVATVPAADGYDVIGSAVAIEGEGGSCEFAINVADAFGGAGLAGTLMRTLIDAAARRGLTVMEGFVLAENEPMLRLARRLGFDVARDPDDASVRICRLSLAAAGAAPGRAPRR